MSLLTHADLLREHLMETDGLDGVAVHVDRKLDVRELATATLSQRTAGAFLSISLGGWTPQNEDGGADAYWAEMRYELSLATVPHILEALEMPTFDELLRRIVVAIQGWCPVVDTLGAYCPDYRWRVGPGTYVPDENFLVYLFPASIGEDFHNPVEIMPATTPSPTP